MSDRLLAARAARIHRYVTEIDTATVVFCDTGLANTLYDLFETVGLPNSLRMICVDDKHLLYACQRLRQAISPTTVLHVLLAASQGNIFVHTPWHFGTSLLPLCLEQVNFSAADDQKEALVVRLHHKTTVGGIRAQQLMQVKRQKRMLAGCQLIGIAFHRITDNGGAQSFRQDIANKHHQLILWIQSGGILRRPSVRFGEHDHTIEDCFSDDGSDDEAELKRLMDTLTIEELQHQEPEADEATLAFREQQQAQVQDHSDSIVKSPLKPSASLKAIQESPSSSNVDEYDSSPCDHETSHYWQADDADEKPAEISDGVGPDCHTASIVSEWSFIDRDGIKRTTVPSPPSPGPSLPVRPPTRRGNKQRRSISQQLRNAVIARRARWARWLDTK